MKEKMEKVLLVRNAFISSLKILLDREKRNVKLVNAYV